MLMLMPYQTDAKLRCTVHRSTSNTAYIATLSTNSLPLRAALSQVNQDTSVTGCKLHKQLPVVVSEALHKTTA
jgi:hypothetical protein